MLDILKLIAVTEGDESGTSTDTLGTEQESVVETETVPSEETVETEVTDSSEETASEIPSEFEIDGEKYSLDDIREWKKSGLRQSDYTKKTQEVAKMRKEAEEALEVYNYLMSKPDLVNKLYELDTDNPDEVKSVQTKLDPVTKQINELNQKLLIKDIESELKEITSKDKLVNDVELLELATANKCSIATAYDMWKGKNVDKILKEKEAEIKRQIAKQAKENADTTRTLIKPTDTKNDNGKFGLDDTQLAFAEKMGMTAEEYSKYSKNPW